MRYRADCGSSLQRAPAPRSVIACPAATDNCVATLTGCVTWAVLPLAVTATTPRLVGSHERPEVGTTTVSSVGEAAVTVAVAPLTVTVFSPGVGPKLIPVIVAVAPGVSSAGATAVTSGALAGGATVTVAVSLLSSP